MILNPVDWSDSHESERISVLESAALLDSPIEETFDQFTRLACAALKAPVSLISLVAQERQFFKSAVGLQEPWASERQTPLSHSFCQYVVHSSEPLYVMDARLNPLLKDNLAIEDLGVVAYLGIPLLTFQEHTLGSFCVIDSQPRAWTHRDMEIMQDIANLVMRNIELRILARQLNDEAQGLGSAELRHRIAELVIA